MPAPGPSTAAPPASSQAPPRPVTVEVALNRPLARFSPAQAIGGALDGHGQGETAPIYTPANLRAMSAAGLGEVAYRLRTELGVQAWHFDQAGRWSEGGRSQGYWTGASRPSGPPPQVTWGYELPRRGDTVDQAEDSGYSRLDDGSEETFWKSDPYLDSHFTHEPDGSHPQWVLIDLGRARAVDALRIDWANPYATRLRVQRYVGGPDAVALAPGRWADFPNGRAHGRPGVQTLRLARRPLNVRFLRILMSASSHTAAPGSRDVRDRLGYAIREVYSGTLDGGRGFRDVLTHAAGHAQTRIYASSTDPWHRAADLNRAYEQPSFQTVLRSGLTRGRPLLVPVPVLYGTPAGAVAELRYLHALGAPLRGVELGEEPDGQLISPEDYGALYVQFARAIHRAFPRLALGGPGFATSLPDWVYWPDARGERSWTRRFVGYLRTRHAIGLLGFFSFEWYPFDDVCAAPGPQLARASRLLRGVLALQHDEGVPRRVPVYVTEYGYSSSASQAEVEMPGALLNADTVGTLLTAGGRAAYLYGYEPNVPIRESGRCDTWGNLMLLWATGAGGTPAPVAAFWETQMLTRDWTQSGDRAHTLYAVGVRFPSRTRAHLASPTRESGGATTGRRSSHAAQTQSADAAGAQSVHAYAVRRPDGRLALLLLNLSPSRSYLVEVRIRKAGALVPSRGRWVHVGPRLGRLPGPVQEWQLSAADYRWRAAGAAGMPELDEPPIHTVLPDGRAAVALPPYSVTVLRSATGRLTARSALG